MSEFTVTQSISLDVLQANSSRVVLAKQNDYASRFLCVRITQKGTAMNISDANQILFGVRRSDGQRKAFYGEVNSDGTANIKLPSWLLEIVGKHTCDVGVLQDDDLLLSTMPFTVEVVEAPCTDDVIVEEEDPSIIATITQLAKAYPDLLNRIYTLENRVGDFDATLDELHAHAQALADKIIDGTYVTYTAGNHTDPRVVYNGKTAELQKQMCNAPYWVFKYRAKQTVNSAIYFDLTFGRYFTFQPTKIWRYLLVDFSNVVPIPLGDVAFHVFERFFSEGDSIDIAEIRFFESEDAAKYYNQMMNDGATYSAGADDLLSIAAALGMTKA